MEENQGSYRYGGGGSIIRFYSSVVYTSPCTALVTTVSESSSVAQQFNWCLFLHGFCGLVCFVFLWCCFGGFSVCLVFIFPLGLFYDAAFCTWSRTGGLLEKVVSKRCSFHQEQCSEQDLMSGEVPFAFLGDGTKSSLRRKTLWWGFLYALYCLSEEQLSSKCLAGNKLTIGTLKTRRYLFS